MNHKQLYCCCLLIGFFQTVFAQNITPSVVNAAGTSQAAVGNVWLEISVGEIATATVTSNPTTITQGVLQPRYVVATPTIELADGRRIRIFPNPTSDVLQIEPTNTTITEVKVIDVSGRVLLSLQKPPLSISVQNLSVGAYFLQIFTADSVVPVSTKFVKN